MSPYPTKYSTHSNWPKPSREAKGLIYVIGAGPSVSGIVTWTPIPIQPPLDLHFAEGSPLTT